MTTKAFSAWDVVFGSETTSHAENGTGGGFGSPKVWAYRYALWRVML